MTVFAFETEKVLCFLVRKSVIAQRFRDWPGCSTYSLSIWQCIPTNPISRCLEQRQTNMPWAVDVPEHSIYFRIVHGVSTTATSRHGAAMVPCAPPPVGAGSAGPGLAAGASRSEPMCLSAANIVLTLPSLH